MQYSYIHNSSVHLLLSTLYVVFKLSKDEIKLYTLVLDSATYWSFSIYLILIRRFPKKSVTLGRVCVSSSVMVQLNHDVEVLLLTDVTGELRDLEG